MFHKRLDNAKIYSLIVHGRKYTILSVQLAKSLEEAFYLAKKEFVDKNPQLGEDMVGAKIGLFEIREVADFLLGSEIKKMVFDSGLTTAEKEKNDLKEKDKKEKNKFIRFLIDSQNTEILHKNKNLFTENEIKYVEEQIAAKKILKDKNKEK